jgi:hypothetical protein
MTAALNIKRRNMSGVGASRRQRGANKMAPQAWRRSGRASKANYGQRLTRRAAHMAWRWRHGSIARWVHIAVCAVPAPPLAPPVPLRK